MNSKKPNPATPEKSKPLTFKRNLNQSTAIALVNVMAIMRGSAGEKTHRERLQAAILKAFPEAVEGIRAPVTEKRTVEIDRRQMFAIIYGMVGVMDNTEDLKTELSRIYLGVFDYFSQLKKLCEGVGIWPQVLELIKPDSTPEWDGEFGEAEDDGLLDGLAGDNEDGRDDLKSEAKRIPTANSPNKK